MPSSPHSVVTRGRERAAGAGGPSAGGAGPDAGLGPVGLTTATARAVLGVPDSLGRADQVADRLAQAIELGLLLDGERLPKESLLAEQLGTATVTLREALATLRGRGLVETRRGRGGGSFVRRTGGGGGGVGSGHTGGDDDAGPLLQRHLRGFTVVQLRELSDHRRAISGMAAFLAAQRAADDDVLRLRQRLDVFAAATSASDRRRAQTQFALEIASAGQAAALGRQELDLHAQLGDLLWHAAPDDQHAQVAQQLDSVVAAIERRACAAAREHAEAAVVIEMTALVTRRLALYREGSR